MFFEKLFLSLIDEQTDDVKEAAFILSDITNKKAATSKPNFLL